ncbi:MAG: hypothetical protein R3C68_14790 [Myxococcota bacterium]
MGDKSGSGELYLAINGIPHSRVVEIKDKETVDIARPSGFSLPEFRRSNPIGAVHLDG